MKNLFMAVLCLLGLTLVSCEKNKSLTSFSSVSDLEGVWVTVDQENYGLYSLEVQKNSIIYRSHVGRVDENNNFICTSSATWDNLIVWTLRYEFDIDNQSVFILGIKAGTFYRTGQNTANFKRANPMWLRDCSLQRVNSVIANK